MRSEDDTWDITTSVGITAIGVAAMRALESRRPDALFHDPYAELLVRAADSDRWGRLLDGGIGEHDDNDEQTARIRTAMGGFMVARTCYFDAYMTGAATAGIRQIVILASGLDARAYRLDWPSGTTVFEIDQPKVLEFKASALAERDVTPSIERREVAVDLRRDWPAALKGAGFDPGKPTAWLAEGLLRYLPSDAQDRLFDNIVALSSPGSRFAANFGTTNPEQAADIQQARARMIERLGIDLDIGTLWYPDEGRSDPADWFAGKDWTVTRTAADQVLTELGRPVTSSHVRRRNLMTATRP